MGSARFVNHPPVELKKVAGMLNLLVIIDAAHRVNRKEGVAA